MIRLGIMQRRILLSTAIFWPSILFPQTIKLADRGADATPVTSLGTAVQGVLSALEDRLKSSDPVAKMAFRFTHLAKAPWPELGIKEIRQTDSGRMLILRDDPRPYPAGSTAKGVRVLEVSSDSATLEYNGDRRLVRPPRSFPAIALRSITKVEGVYVVFINRDPKAYSQGVDFEGARIVGIDERSVTFEFNGETRKAYLATQEPTFPTLVVAGVIRIGNNWAVVFQGDQIPRSVGDTIQGAKIVDVRTDGVSLEFVGKIHWIPAILPQSSR